MIEVILNGKKIETEEGISILDLARKEGIQIPTLCHDDELNPYGSCWVCAVEVKGRKGFVTSCGTMVSPGMEIVTDSEDIHAARKMALELLISNHYADCEAPCKLACPDHVDVQSYVSLIANGQYHDAVKVIKDTLPMPLSIGRVCPAFCEQECRRQIVEDSVAIRQLKRYAADEDLGDVWNYVPAKEEPTGKRIAIIGAGPSGLTCGYYLTNNGHEVRVFEAAPQAGGWLRYGIPEYRLPKEILDAEIDLMCLNGMQIDYGICLGKDVYLAELSKSYDAVYVAIGAQKAVPMPVKGSDLQGCHLGVDFLKAHAMGDTPHLGKKVAVVGGGNTAIDCARTAIRLGCEVSVIYRRTREEMPAESFEIDAAAQEGVQFHFLSNPVEYLGDAGKLTNVVIEKMKLGEPDSSGRRRPEPTGDFFNEEFDSIIAAISQVPEVDLFAEEENKIDGQIIPLSRWQTVVSDEKSMYTGLDNVFAGGDFRRGAATAIEAIADGRAAAEAIDRYLKGQPIQPRRAEFDSKKGYRIEDISTTEYEIYRQIERIKMPELPLPKAVSTFEEVELGFSEYQARSEASRCLECGCQINETCALREYCTEYEVDALNFPGSINKHPIDHTHPYILRDTNKCINCARCLRTCAEIQGPAVLGFIHRGFAAVVVPEFGQSLTQTTCESCGKCIAVCPVGALAERNAHYKLNPLTKDETVQNCGLCGSGCYIKVETQSGVPTLIETPDEDDLQRFNGRNLCFNGRFGWQALIAPNRLKQPRLREGSVWKDISWREARELIRAKAAQAKTMRFEISPDITTEEMLIAKKAAENANAVLRADASILHLGKASYFVSPDPQPYGRLDEYDEYIVCDEVDLVLRTMLRLRQRKGKKLIFVGDSQAPWLRFVDAKYDTIEELPPGGKRLYLYNINRISTRGAWQVWKLAKDSEDFPRNIMVGTHHPNLGGLIAIEPSFAPAEPADFVMVWGAKLRDEDCLSFQVSIQHFEDDNSRADLLLPQVSYLEISASMLGNYGAVSFFHDPAKSNKLCELLKVFYELGWITPALADINPWNAMADELIEELKGKPYPVFDPDSVNPADLDNVVRPAISELDIKMAALFERRRNISQPFTSFKP
ncbi:MAG: FAD-dependent oxidoreductase [Candidatus Cloacimonetes bacterium]|nr:FAD-dependent oxidoreductase [Candidatus Cloacimonadota bacterium]